MSCKAFFFQNKTWLSLSMVSSTLDLIGFSILISYILGHVFDKKKRFEISHTWFHLYASKKVLQIDCKHN